MRITQDLLNRIYVGYKANFQNGFGGVAPKWNRVAMEVPSSTAAETYGWLGQFPRIREWVGDRVINQLMLHDYTIRNREFESTVSLKRNDVEDDRVGLLAPVMTEMGRNAAAFPDELVYAALGAGFSTNCYDGQFFFDTDHPVLNAQGRTVTWSNVQAGSGPAWYLLDTSRAIKAIIYQNRRSPEFVNKTDPQNSEHVFMKGEFLYGVDMRCNAGYGFPQLAFASRAALTSANFRAARNAMSALTGDYGRPLGIRPNLLVVPTALEDAARDLLLADRLPNGASNVDYKAVEILVVEWLPNV